MNLPETHEGITALVRHLYAAQREPGNYGGTTPKLALLIAEPDALIEHAVILAGEQGITDAQIRRVVPVAREPGTSARSGDYRGRS